MMRRYEAQPPKLDPEISVVAGEPLELETDGQRVLRLAGKPVSPYIVVNGTVLYPRRPYRSVPQPLSDVLARARQATMDER